MNLCRNEIKFRSHPESTLEGPTQVRNGINPMKMLRRYPQHDLR